MVMAIDREMLVKHLMKGQYEAAYGIVPPLPGYPAFRPEWADMPDAERIALAQRLYAEAGYSAEHPLDVEFNSRWEIRNSPGVRSHGGHVANAPGRQCQAGRRGLAGPHAEPGNRQAAHVLVVMDRRLSGPVFLSRIAHGRERPELRALYNARYDAHIKAATATATGKNETRITMQRRNCSMPMEWTSQSISTEHAIC